MEIVLRRDLFDTITLFHPLPGASQGRRKEVFADMRSELRRAGLVKQTLITRSTILMMRLFTWILVITMLRGQHAQRSANDFPGIIRFWGINECGTEADLWNAYPSITRPFIFHFSDNTPVVLGKFLDPLNYQFRSAVE